MILSVISLCQKTDNNSFQMKTLNTVLNGTGKGEYTFCEYLRIFVLRFYSPALYAVHIMHHSHDGHERNYARKSISFISLLDHTGVNGRGANAPVTGERLLVLRGENFLQRLKMTSRERLGKTRQCQGSQKLYIATSLRPHPAQGEQLFQLAAVERAGINDVVYCLGLCTNVACHAGRKSPFVREFRNRPTPVLIRLEPHPNQTR